MGRQVAFAINGRPSRWERPTEVFDARKGRVIRITAKKAKAGKKVIAQCAKLAWGRDPPACGPVRLGLTFVFAIPVSWPPALKTAAREGRVLHIQDPDIDQLIKQVQDALVGIVYVDDNQVARLGEPVKRYGSPERTEIRIEVLDQLPDEITPGQLEVRKRAVKAGLLPPDRQPALFGPGVNPAKSIKDRRP